MDLNFTGTDVCAINGTRSATEAKYDVVVIGAGPSGIAAAIEAGGSGSKGVRVGENPVSGAPMGDDFVEHKNVSTQNLAQAVDDNASLENEARARAKKSSPLEAITWLQQQPALGAAARDFAPAQTAAAGGAGEGAPRACPQGGGRRAHADGETSADREPARRRARGGAERGEEGDREAREGRDAEKS